MFFRLAGDGLFGSALSVSKAEGADNKLAAGRALAVRPMIARQMLLALNPPENERA